MPRTIRNASDLDALRRRMGSLRPDSRPLWGTMDAERMLLHVANGLEQALGERPDDYRGNFLMRSFAKWLVVRVLPRMPHGAPTSPAMLAERDDSRPSSFEADRARVLALLERNADRPARQPFADHPAFGPLSHEERGILTWKHVDHHLRQFGA